MDETISSGRLQKLLGIKSASLSTLAAEGVVVRGEKRGSYLLEPSMRGYIGRLQAAARGRVVRMPRRPAPGLRPPRRRYQKRKPGSLPAS